ncbi:MAG: hypothetical protein R2844_09525 [Caldilineales bacterium]
MRRPCASSAISSPTRAWATANRAQMQFYAGTDRPVDLILSGDKAFVGYDQQWQQVDAPPGGVAPGGDYLGYLVAATDVAEGDQIATPAGTFRRYTFNFDGQRYAEHQRDEAYRMLASQLPQGMQLELHPVYRAMTGNGELWVDSNGLPRRQILTLDMPGVTDSYDAHGIDRRIFALRRSCGRDFLAAARRRRR